VIDLLKGYFKIGDRDEHREIREGLGTGAGAGPRARAGGVPIPRA